MDHLCRALLYIVLLCLLFYVSLFSSLASMSLPTRVDNEAELTAIRCGWPVRFISLDFINDYPGDELPYVPFTYSCGLAERPIWLDGFLPVAFIANYVVWAGFYVLIGELFMRLWPHVVRRQEPSQSQ